MTTVTEADREAYLALNMLPEKYAEAIRAGEWDEVTGLQAFARHREAAEQRGRLEGAEIMREAAAKDAEEWFPGDKKTLFPKYGVVAAIRHLDPAAIIAQHARTKEES